MAGINAFGSLGNAPATDFHMWMDDFDFYLATSWVITETGSGTRAIGQTKDGVLLITNGSNDDDANFLQARDVASGQVAEHWKWDSTKSLMFEVRFKTSDATQSDLVFGLQTTDTTPLATANGIWFGKDDGDANLDFHVAASSTQTNLTAFATLSNDTWTVLTFYYDASASLLQVYKDGVAVGSAAITNAPSVTLVISFGIQNGEAVAKTLSIDYIKVVQARG